MRGHGLREESSLTVFTENRRGVLAPGKRAVVGVYGVGGASFGTNKRVVRISPIYAAVRSKEPGGESGRRFSVTLERA